jgi:hypothetical protein
MTNYYDDKDPDDRDSYYMAPPQFYVKPNPAGRVHYAEVVEDDQFVGGVWMTVDKEPNGPRAGIVLVRIPGTKQFQTELGQHALNYSRDNEVAAEEWIEQITATNTGLTGLMVGNEGYAETLDELKQSLRSRA